MTNLLTIIVVLLFAALIYGFYLLQKRHVKFSTRVCGVVRRDRFWWRAAADFWDRL